MPQYPITDFGASTEVDNNSDAISKAIRTCADAGGGKVTVPYGIFNTGSIQILDNVELHLEKGAVLQGINDPVAYQSVEKKPLPGCPEDARNRYPKKATVLIWSKSANQISLTGKGRIIGPTPTGDVKAPLRPSIVSFIDSSNIRISGVSIENSTFWSVHLLNSRDIVVEDCSVSTPLDRINGDGIDPDGCSNVRISRCTVSTGDDAICIKTSEGRQSENIIVEDCLLQSGCAAAIKLGTESIGDIQNVRIRNCTVRRSHWGIMVYAKDGGCYSDVEISDCKLETWAMMSMLVDITPRFYKEPVYGGIDGLTIRNCTFAGPGKVLVEGKPDHPVRNLTLQNIVFNLSGDIPENEVRKPNGAGLVDIDPEAVNYAALPYQLIGAHIDEAKIRNIVIDGEPAADRIYFENSGKLDTDQ